MRKIDFKIHWANPEDVYTENASLSLGWFELCYRGFTICFFKDGYCMIFLNLITLIEYLVSNKETINPYDWVGEDHGAIIRLSKQGSSLDLMNPDVSIKIDYPSFKQAVLQAAISFKASCLQENPSIRKEGTFMDLHMYLEKYKRHQA